MWTEEVTFGSLTPGRLYSITFLAAAYFFDAQETVAKDDIDMACFYRDVIEKIPAQER